MHFAQFYTPGLAQCSYLVGSGSTCVVVDPVRNVEAYLAKAREFGMEITGILETHLHADFISGHMELQALTGAPIYAPRIANCAFPHEALKDGQEFTIDKLHFKLLETPGHTPDCSVYVVTDLERGSEPLLAFTGDTLMVGDVGRPDLFPNREEELAEKLFSSLARLRDLPDHVEVYPAHGMGSLCGRALSAKLWSTVGFEKRFNYALQHRDLAAFKKDLLTGMPAAPDHFARCSEINRTGPALKKNLPPVAPLSPEAVAAAAAEGTLVLDVRPYHSFAAAHLPGSFSISRDGNLPTFAGWVVPPDRDLVLVLDRGATHRDISGILYNVGLDRITGYLDGSLEGWVNRGLPVSRVETLSVQELKPWLTMDAPPILDTRGTGEWQDGHIKGTLHCPTPDVRHRHKEWDPATPLVVLCNTSNRSMTAASLLKQRGFLKVYNVMGGTTAWQAAGYPLEKDGEGQ